MPKKATNPNSVAFEPIKIIPIKFYGNEESSSKKNKSNLTQTQKNKIKNITGKCEISSCNNAPYNVHHIKFVEDGGTDVYSNLIVLCSNCHDDAHGKNPHGKIITKSKLKEIVKNRSKTRAEQIKAVLQKVKSNSESNPPLRDHLDFNFFIFSLCFYKDQLFNLLCNSLTIVRQYAYPCEFSGC